MGVYPRFCLYFMRLPHDKTWVSNLDETVRTIGRWWFHQLRTGLSYRLRKIPGLFVFGEPEVCVVAFGSKRFDIFTLGTELTDRHWKLNPLQFPSRFVSILNDCSLHISFSARYRSFFSSLFPLNIDSESSVFSRLSAAFIFASLYLWQNLELLRSSSVMSENAAIKF